MSGWLWTITALVCDMPRRGREDADPLEDHGQRVYMLFVGKSVSSRHIGSNALAELARGSCYMLEADSIYDSTAQ